MIVDASGIHYINTANGKEIRMIDQYSVSAIDISPRDTYLITSEKFVQGQKNLIVWNTNTGREVVKFEWKKQSKEGPKSIKFTKDEKYCGRLSARNTIEIY